MTEKLLTAAEAAQLKGVTRTAIYKAIAQDRLPYQRVLGRIALKEADVLKWVATGSKPGRQRGVPMTDDEKARISATQKQRWAERKNRPQDS